MAESTTENIFREFYGASTFVEKRDIPKEFGFQSKRAGSAVDGFPDFFKDMGEWLIVVEAKSGAPGPKSTSKIGMRASGRSSIARSSSTSRCSPWLSVRADARGVCARMSMPTMRRGWWSR